ncbi:MAG: potassium channel family protein [Melioribacteraceae bacterium]|nr:potassium channel family protein [Melioribacteraceae bacterium]
MFYFNQKNRNSSIYHLFNVDLKTIFILTMKIIRNKLQSLVENESFLNEETLKRDNFILLFSLALIIFIHPLIKMLEIDNWAFDILLSMLIISCITSLKFRKEKFIQLSYFGLFTFTLIWINHFVGSLVTNLLSFIVLVFFTIYITYSMISYVARNKEISSVLLLNAINSYLLLGIIGSFLYILSDIGYKLVFDITNGTINFGYTSNPTFYDYIYFSFITLTTVGYGDVTPAIPFTKSLTMFVSLSGQLYLTILVALLVGKFLSKKNN